MAVLGIADMKQFAVPAGVDASVLTKYQLADGTTFEAVVNLINQGLSTASESILSDPRYGGMLYVTSEIMLEYRYGTTNGMQERTETETADARRGKTIGHMLPLKSYDRTLGWTRDFLLKARNQQLIADVSDALYDVRDNVEKRALTRFFSITDNVIGSVGYDASFVNGSAAITYQPPAFDGKTFATSHTHFDRKTDDSTGRAAALEAGALHLKEHGIMGPYLAIIPEADISDFTGLGAKFYRPDRGFQFIRTDSAANWGVAQINPEVFVGLYETDHGVVSLWSTPRLPTNYLGFYKSYGLNDQRNPLAMRFDPTKGAGAILQASDIYNYPLMGAVIEHTFGMGIGEGRLNGYCCYFNASGSYTNPTIS